MYHHDDRDSAAMADRFIAGVIGGICGFLFGGLIDFAIARLFAASFGLEWWLGAAFAVYAWLAPSRSTALWSGFWHGIFSAFGRTRHGS